MIRSASRTVRSLIHAIKGTMLAHQAEPGSKMPPAFKLPDVGSLSVAAAKNPGHCAEIHPGSCPLATPGVVHGPLPKLAGKLSRKHWTSAWNRASLVPLRGAPRASPGSRPAGFIARAGLRRSRRTASLHPSKGSQPCHSRNHHRTRRAGRTQSRLRCLRCSTAKRARPCNRLAASLGPRLFDSGGAQKARPDAQTGSQGRVTSMPRPTFDREAIEAEIDRVRSLGLDALRTVAAAGLRQGHPGAVPLLAHSGAGFRRAGFSRPKSISADSRGAIGHERIALGASSPAPCSCANTRASVTPSSSLRMATSGVRRPMPTSQPSRGPSPARPGTVPAFLASGAAANLRLRQPWPMRHRDCPTGNLRGKQESSHLRPSPRDVGAANPLLQYLPFRAGSADHESGRSNTPALRDLYPQICFRLVSPW